MAAQLAYYWLWINLKVGEASVADATIVIS
jgi:hypothetical protein